MTTRLQVYNDALLLCGEALISSLTESREGRRLLDHAWDSGEVEGCLEKGQWAFAMRTVLLDYDPSVTPSFGYRRAFSKPTDWLATSAVCSDEYFRSPLTQYADESGYWYCDLDELYVRYVSNGDTYGMNLTIWPQAFSDFVAASLANKIVRKLTGSAERVKDVDEALKRAKFEAASHNAMGEPTKFPAPSSWNSARNRGSRRRDGGGRGSLIG